MTADDTRYGCWRAFGRYGTISFVQHQYSLSQIYTPIASELTDVRAIVSGAWRETLALVSAPDAGQQQAEGKLLRPALCLLAAGALGKNDLQQYARLAAAYELIHIASLTHDDVVDHATLRRGHDSLNMLWNNHTAILGGDYLVARALELLVAYDSCSLVNAALQAMRRMAEGELRYFGRDNTDTNASDCVALAESKTASLFAAACAAPAVLLSPEQAQPLHDFGIALGIAFQLTDDLLDLTQTSATLGKPACGDITEGKHTLPLHLLREAMNDADRERLCALHNTTLTEEEQQWVRDMVGRLGVDKALLEKAEAYIAKAMKTLEGMPDTACKTSMGALAQFVLMRHA